MIKNAKHDSIFIYITLPYKSVRELLKMTINTYSLLVFCGLHDSNEKRKKKKPKQKKNSYPELPEKELL